MKNLFKTVFLLIIIQMLFTSGVYAAVLDNSFLKQEIEKNVVRNISEKIQGEVNVIVLKLPYSSIEVPEGKIKFNIKVNTDYISSKTIVRVNITFNGRNIQSFGVPVEISIKDYVWVSTEVINKRKAFNFQNIKLEKKDITDIVNYAVRKDFEYTNYLASKMYRPGDIINKRYIESTPDVIKNSTVFVIFQTKNLKLTLDGEAMEDGKIGDYIRVKNKKYRKYYTGRIIDSNQILVKM